MTAYHERMLAWYIKHPDSTATDLWGDGAPLDAGTAMILASNAAHLGIESLRQLVTDPTTKTYQLASGKDTWEGIVDASGPTPSDASASTAGFQRVSWGPDFTRRYGPFHVIADRETADGRLVQRTIKAKIRYQTLGSTNTTLHAVLTTHPSARSISLGDVVLYSSKSIATSETSTFDFTWSPDLEDRPTEQMVCRAGAAGRTGPVQVWVLPFYLWLCVSSVPGVIIYSVSFWEDR